MHNNIGSNAAIGFTPRTAMEEAARCLLCHDAPCSQSCPAGTDPARFIRSIRFRNVKGAAETIRENNALGGVCARVCPYDQLCEQACSRCGIDRPIQIGKLQRFAIEQEAVYSMKTLEKGAPNGKKVACVGGGPASLAAAAELAKKGYDVTIYEAQEKLGGYLTYGIAEDRLPQSVVDFDIDKVLALGIHVVNRTRVGTDLSFEDLRSANDAVFVGTGLWKAKLPSIPGVDLPGVTNAVDFLRTIKCEGGALVEGKRVIVIGGGDVAMDCASAAKLNGAEKVAIWYRRTIDEAPADRGELQYIMQLGVPMTTDMAPKAVEGNGKAEYMCFSGRDGSSEARVACDLVVFAIGQAPDELCGLCVKTDGKGLITAENGRTSMEGVFAAGDAVNGGKTVVEAVGAGKAAAAAIDAYLNGKGCA